MIPEKVSFNLFNWVEQEAEVFINSWLGREVTVTPHVHFSYLPKDLYDRIFREAGPAILKLARTSATYQKFLDAEYPAKMQSYRQALALLNKSYLQIKPYKDSSIFYTQKNIDHLNTSGNRRAMEEAYLFLTRALTLISPKSAIKITDCMKTKKPQALIAIAKDCSNTKDAMGMITLAIVASEKLSNLRGFCDKFDALFPVLKMLKQYGPEKMPRIADLATTISDCLTIRSERVAKCAHLLYKIHPQKATDLILSTLKEVEEINPPHLNRKSDAFNFLLPSLALLDLELALEKARTLPIEYRTSVLMRIINALAPDNPRKTLELRDQIFAENPPTGLVNLLADASILTICGELEKASIVFDKVIALTQNYDELQKEMMAFRGTRPENHALAQGGFQVIIAEVLKRYNRERALDLVKNTLFVVHLEDNPSHRFSFVKNATNLLIDLNDKNLTIKFVEYAIMEIKDLKVDFYQEDKDETILVLAIALVPFDMKRALEICEYIESPFYKSLAEASMALRLFEQ